ncbi:MAG: hypothetical protein FWC77_01480 [Defluviitaleaceae bacterium]|nr:hypothetical protein [Defluviitaleaceae bacterium]
MAFPSTHLLVADALLTRQPRPDRDAAQFILGALAPDGVHYRTGFTDAGMGDIGHAKKITHLCPVSEERWGAVTDNRGWVSSVKTWLQNNSGPLADGYAAHVLTDLYNNMTLWERIRTQHPAVAAKGYASDYYRDLHEIDLRLYLEHVKNSRIEPLLAKAKPQDMPRLVSAEEIGAIRDNILHENYKSRTPDTNHKYGYVTYDETLDFIAEAVEAVLAWL